MEFLDIPLFDDDFYKMILITGSTGFVGMHLLKELSESKTQIVAMYRSENKKKMVECFFNNTNSKIEINEIEEN